MANKTWEELVGTQPVQQQAVAQQEEAPSYATSDYVAIDRPTSSDLMSYGWNVYGDTDFNALAKIGRTQGWYNVGKFEDGEYKTLEELYGDDFSSLSTDQKRERINAVEEQNRQRDYLNVIAYGEQDSALATASGFVGSLATPTTFLPISGVKYGIKGVAAASALFGAEYDLLNQYATKGDVDWTQAATVTALSAGLGGGITALPKAIRFAARGRGTKPLTEVEKANMMTAKIEDVYADAVLEGVATKDMHAYALEKLGMTADELAAATADSSNKIRVPTPQQAREMKELAAKGIDANTIATNPTVNKLITPIIEQIGKIDEALGTNYFFKNNVRGYFFKSYNNAMQKIEKSSGMLDLYKKMPQNIKDDLDNLLINANRKNINNARKLIENYQPGAGKYFDDFRGQIDQMGDELRKAQYKLPDNPYYVPRRVKDFDGLSKYLKKAAPDLSSGIEKAMQKRAEYLKTTTDRLSKEDRNFITTSILRGLRVGTNDATGNMYAAKYATNSKEGLLMQRRIKTVNKDMQKFYETPLAGSMQYFMDAQKLVERVKFFDSIQDIDKLRGRGTNTKHAVKTEDGINIDKSIESWVKSHGLTGDLQSSLQSALHAVMVDADKSMGKAARLYKDIAHGVLLGNIGSALTQLGDLGMSAWVFGLRNTLSGLVSKNKVSAVKDLNLDSAVLEHFSSGTRVTESVNKLLNWSQFKRMDSLGKNVIINAAWKQVQKQVRTPEGIAKLKKEYGTAFGPNFDNFVREVQNGELTERTKEYLFNRLSDIQPVSPAEMPEKYLRMQDGRILYTLHSFTLKQLNLIRKGIVEEYKKGNKAVAARNAIAFSLLVPTSNMTIGMAKDLIAGKDIDLESEVGQRYIDNVFKVFASSQYGVAKLAKTGKVGDFILDSVAPPLNMFDNIIKGGITAISTGEFDPRMGKNIPLLGSLWYNWFGGGVEEYQEKQKKKQRSELRERYGIGG